MTELLILAGYSGLILLASWGGGWIPLIVRLTHTRLQLATSFVAGLMLGVGLLHLLPHAWYESRSIDTTVRWALGGFISMFFIQRFFHFHHHDVPEDSPEAAAIASAGHAHHGHGHHHHAVGDRPQQSLAEKSAGHLSWTGAAVGLSLHSLTDGVALAASVMVESSNEHAAWLAGLGTFLVIILHKPFDAMAIGTLMASSGSSRRARHLVNALFALAIPAGVALFYVGAAHYAHVSNHFLGAALAFAAGCFLCIAASDLLPELQFHAHDRFKLSMALVAGLLLSVLVGRFESHGHDHSDHANPQHDHQHEAIQAPH